MPKKYSKDKLTTRTYNLEIRADENESGVIEGVPIVFNKETNISDWCGEYREVIDPHALDKADLKDVLLCVNHDVTKLALARSKNGKGTMTLEVKEDGLHMRAKLDVENNTDAKNLYSAIQRGDMDGMSFMFRVDSDEWSDVESKNPLRTIKRISIVHEVSVVNFPAYKQTSVNARSEESEGSYSPLAEIREQLKVEAERQKKANAELEKMKYTYLLGGKI